MIRKQAKLILYLKNTFKYSSMLLEDRAFRSQNLHRKMLFQWVAHKSVINSYAVG